MKKISLTTVFIIVAIVVLGLIGCASKTKPTVSTPLQFSVQLTIEGASPKTVTIDSGSSALAVIQEAYTYEKGTRSTTINGISNSWSYTVNGEMPIDTTGRLDSQGNPLYLGIAEYQITKDCTIDLQRLIKP